MTPNNMVRVNILASLAHLTQSHLFESKKQFNVFKEMKEIQIEKDNHEEMFNMAYVWISLGNYTKAYACLDSILQNKTDSLDSSLLKLITSHAQASKLTCSQKDGLEWNFILILISQGKLIEAQEYWNGFKSRKDSTLEWENMEMLETLILERKNGFPFSEKDLKTKFESSWTYTALLVQFYLLQQRYEPALLILETFYSKNPQFTLKFTPSLASFYIFLLEKNGNSLVKGIEFLNQAIEHHLNQGDLFGYVSILLKHVIELKFKCKEYSGAILDIQKLIQLNSDLNSDLELKQALQVQLVLAKSFTKCQAQEIQNSWKELNLTSFNISTLDKDKVDSLERFTEFYSIKQVVDVENSIKKNKKRKRKPLLPKDVSRQAKDLDPERWLAKRDRSGFKKKHVKHQTTGFGYQGASLSNNDKHGRK